jgi:hypothetical protein
MKTLHLRFIEEVTGTDSDQALQGRLEEERELQESVHGFERIVLWMEHDTYDQLVLVRSLAHYATLRTCPALELVNVDRVPGSIRFLGLGQLPPEALRLLWEQRRPVAENQLSLAAKTWSALTNEDPRDLAAIMRSNTPALPLLAPALRRLLQGPPSVENGTGVTRADDLAMPVER